jgi:hypothetical protein
VAGIDVVAEPAWIREAIGVVAQRAASDLTAARTSPPGGSSGWPVAPREVESFFETVDLAEAAIDRRARTGAAWPADSTSRWA